MLLQPLKDVITVVFAVFLIFSVLAVQFWTDLPRVMCESNIERCDRLAILDPADTECFCDAVGISWEPSHREDEMWVWVKTVPAAAAVGAVNFQAVDQCVGQPRSEQHFHCDSMGMIKFDQIGWTMIAVFQCLTLEGWTDIMYAVDATSENSVGWIFFVSLVLFGGFFVVQLALAVITNAYEEVSNEEKHKRLGARVAAVDRTGWFWRLKEKAKRGEADPDGWVQTLRMVVESKAVVNTVTFFIAVNTVFLAIEYHDEALCDAQEDVDGRLHGTCMPASLQCFLEIANVVLTVFFTIEMALKLVALGVVEYISDGMNKFDGFIVLVRCVLSTQLFCSFLSHTILFRINKHN